MTIDSTEVEQNIEFLEALMKIENISDFKIYKLATKRQYDNNQYKKMANTYIGKIVKLPSSKKHNESEYFIETVTSIPRSIQQRLGYGNSTSWDNMIYLFNKYTDQEIKPNTTIDIMKLQGKDTIKIEQFVYDFTKKYGDCCSH